MRESSRVQRFGVTFSKQTCFVRKTTGVHCCSAEAGTALYRRTVKQYSCDLHYPRRKVGVVWRISSLVCSVQAELYHALHDLAVLYNFSVCRCLLNMPILD